MAAGGSEGETSSAIAGTNSGMESVALLIGEEGPFALSPLQLLGMIQTRLTPWQ